MKGKPTKASHSSPERGTPRRAAGYIRVSAVGGREGDSFLSPDVQREKIEAWAAYRDYRIVQWYIDLDRSGKTGSVRPEFDRMMKDAAEGRFEMVAVYRLTRFARSMRDASAAYDDLEKLDVGLVSVTEDIDSTSIAGNLLRNMLFAMAEFESQRIGEEWRNVHANRRRRGIAHVAKPTFGFRTEGAEIVGVEFAEAPAVRQMYELRVRGGSYGEIRSWLAEHGFRSKKGNPRFATSTLASMLRNPLYAGLVRLPDGELVEAKHEGIVTRELWEAVQATHGRADLMARHHSRRLLSGFLVCSGCGGRMRLDKWQGKAPAYRCASRNSSHRCPRQVSVTAAPAEDWVERAFLRRFDPKRMPHNGRLKQTRQQQAWQRKAAKLRARADELGRALDNLADERYVKGTLAAAEYDRQFQRYAAEKAHVEEQAADLERLIATVQPLEQDVMSLWPKLRVEAKRKALRLVIAHVTVSPAPSQGGRRDRGVDLAKRLEIGWLR